MPYQHRGQWSGFLTSEAVCRLPVSHGNTFCDLPQDFALLFLTWATKTIHREFGRSLSKSPHFSL